MKVIACACCLIFFVLRNAGISGEKVAEQSSNLLIVNEDNGFIPDTTIDVFVLLLQSKDVVKNFTAGCKEHGGITGFKNFKDSVRNFVTSATKVENRLRTELGKELNQNATAVEEVVIFIKEVCYEFVPNLTKATKKLIKSYKNCFENKTRDDIDADGGLGLDLLQYLCKNNGSHILELFEDEKSSCRKIVEPLIDECMNKPDMVNYAEDNAALLRMSLLTSVGLGRETCQYVEKTRDCYVDALDKCEDNPKAGIIADKIDGIFHQDKSCDRKIADKPEELKSAGGIKNVSPIIAGSMTIIVTLLLYLQ